MGTITSAIGETETEKNDCLKNTEKRDSAGYGRD